MELINKAEFHKQHKVIHYIFHEYSTHRISTIIANNSYSQQASHKPNPTTIPRGIVDSYSTIVHVRGGNSCGGYTLMGAATTHTV